MSCCFSKIQEAVEDRDISVAEEIVNRIECYDQMRGIARKIFDQMQDPSCYTFPIYKIILERAYRISHDYCILNLIKRVDKLEESFEDVGDEEDDYTQDY